MFITHLKSEESLEKLIAGKKLFIINCYGCKEVYFPIKEADEYQKKLAENMVITKDFISDFVCNEEDSRFRLDFCKKEIEEADAILVFSCGVGVQTIAEIFPDKPVYAACDTIHLPGVQGATPLDVDCGQCGECFLNLTGGICPITACSKSLVNGPCGGTKNGKCEVNPNMDCGWERIYQRLKELGRLEEFKAKTQFHNYQTFEVTKEHKETEETIL